MALPKPRLSLKARALQWLAQREQSRVELRRKLLRLATADSSNHSDAYSNTESSAETRPVSGADSRGESSAEDSDASSEPSPSSRVEAVLDWLEANNYLSQERFAESRINARAGRYGNLRIRQELRQHQVELSADARRMLAQTELDRALSVRERKFAALPASAEERAKQARFLAGRGFSPEVIGKALRASRSD
jgi:regulatory protein